MTNIKALSDAATPGVWEASDGPVSGEYEILSNGEYLTDMKPSDAAFICELVKAYRDGTLVEAQSKPTDTPTGQPEAGDV